MTVSTPGRTRMCVTVALDAEPPAAGDVVLAALLQCFTAVDPVEVAIFLRGSAVLDEATAAAVLARCEAVCPAREAMPDVVLLEPGETPEHPVVLEVEQTGDVVADVRAVVLVANLAREVWADQPPAPAQVPASRPAPLTLRDASLGGTGELPQQRPEDAAELAALLARLAGPGNG